MPEPPPPGRSLFQFGPLTLHSGQAASWKIDCEALGDEDLRALARITIEGLRLYGSVEGVPTGGLRFAEALRAYVSSGPVLIVDDVLTTGASMEQQRAGREAIGVAIFARGPWPSWVTPLFATTEAVRVALTQARRAALEEAKLIVQAQPERKHVFGEHLCVRKAELLQGLDAAIQAADQEG